MPDRKFHRNKRWGDCSICDHGSPITSATYCRLCQPEKTQEAERRRWVWCGLDPIIAEKTKRALELAIKKPRLPD